MSGLPLALNIIFLIAVFGYGIFLKYFKKTESCFALVLIVLSIVELLIISCLSKTDEKGIKEQQTNQWLVFMVNIIWFIIYFVINMMSSSSTPNTNSVPINNTKGNIGYRTNNVSTNYQPSAPPVNNYPPPPKYQYNQPPPNYSATGGLKKALRKLF